MFVEDCTVTVRLERDEIRTIAVSMEHDVYSTIATHYNCLQQNKDGEKLGFINKSLMATADNPGTAGDVSRFNNKCSDPELELLMGQLLAFVEIYRGMGYHSNAIEGEGLHV